MTNQEAIMRIKEHIRIHQIWDPRAIKISEALDMAISALEAQELDSGNGDCISRAAVIDAITDENIIRNMDSVMDSEIHRVKRSVHRIIASIPSAQAEIIRCEDCKHIQK